MFTQKSFGPISSHGNSDMPSIWTYRTSDTIAEVISTGYFKDKYPVLNDGDSLNCQCSDGEISGVFKQDLDGYFVEVMSSSTDSSGNMNWLFDYVPGQAVITGDNVRSGQFTMIANKPTTDAAAPHPIDEFSWAIFSDAPNFAEATTSAVRLLTGVRIKAEHINLVEGLRVWIPYIDPDVQYLLYFTAEGEVPNYIEIFPSVTGWFVYTNVSYYVIPGKDLDLYLVTQGQGTGFTEFTGSWDYRNIGATPRPELPPEPSNFRQYGTNAPETVYWNVYDEALVDRTADLATLKAGDQVSFQWLDGGTPIDEYTIWSLTETPTFWPGSYGDQDQTYDMYELTVSPAAPPSDDGQRSYRDFTARVFQDRPLEYVFEAGKFAGNEIVRGLFSTDGTEGVVETDDAYGIDLFTQRWDSSDDWDLVAYSGLGSGSAVASLTPVLSLYAPSTSNQNPAGTDNPLPVEFGAAQYDETFDVSLEVDGTIHFNRTGVYQIRAIFAFSRTSSPGQAYLSIRALLDGVQFGLPITAEVSDDEMTIPLEFTSTLMFDAGQVLTFELMRGSNGNNNGGLAAFENSLGWGTSPSASIRITKF